MTRWQPSYSPAGNASLSHFRLDAVFCAIWAVICVMRDFLVGEGSERRTVDLGVEVELIAALDAAAGE